MQKVTICVEGEKEEYVARVINEVVLKVTAKHDVKLKGYEQKTMIPVMAEIRVEANTPPRELQIPDFLKRGNMSR